jgi:hypothetical protein
VVRRRAPRRAAAPPRRSLRRKRPRRRRTLNPAPAQAPGCSPTWTQNTEEVIVRVPVDAGTRGRDVAFEAHPKRLLLKVGGQELLGGSLADAGEIDIDGGARLRGGLVAAGAGAAQGGCAAAAAAAAGPSVCRRHALSPAPRRLVCAPRRRAAATFWTLEAEGDRKELVVTLGKKVSGHESWQYLLEADRPDTTVTQRVSAD